MTSLPAAADWVLFAGLYLLILLGGAWLQRREFARRPDKQARYAALPRRYKLACRCGVMPLFAGTVQQPWLLLAALPALLLLEIACVRWYRRQGLF